MKFDKAAVIVAAGKSARLGLGKNKALLELNSTPIFIISVKKFIKAGYDFCVICAPENEIPLFAEQLRLFALDKNAAVIAGGAERSNSVLNGLQYLASGNPQFVAIHDAARPFFDEHLLNIEFAETDAGFIYAAPVKDTIKSVENRRILKTLNRPSLIAVQTPQIFRYAAIHAAYKKSRGRIFTDDAALIEETRHVKYIPSSDMNFKITTPKDLQFAQYLLDTGTVKI